MVMSGLRKAPVALTEVAVAMRELREEGVTVSVRAVQERVGRGSLSTITKHMASVNAGNETPELHLEQFPERLEALCREMVLVMDELAVERVSKEREQVEATRRNIESRWNNLLLEKETATRDLDAERRANAELRQRLSEATQALEGLRDELGEWKTRAASAEAQVVQLGERLLQANQQIEHLRSYIENYERQVEQQRQRDSDHYSQKIGSMEIALNKSMANELSLTTQLGEANRTKERLTADLRAAQVKREQDEKERSELHAVIAQMSVEQNETKKREQRSEEQLDRAQAARDTLQAEVTSLQTQLIAAQGRIDKIRDDAAAESRSVILNLVAHARRLFDVAQSASKKSDPELLELAIAQKEIERLFNYPS